MKNTLLGLSLLCLCAVAAAQDSGALEPAPQPPQLPPPVESGESLEPQVTITQDQRGTIQQYSVNGQVYMIKVVPSAGPPYYLVDTNGDGIVDSREDDIYNVSVQQWVLFSW